MTATIQLPKVSRERFDMSARIVHRLAVDPMFSPESIPAFEAAWRLAGGAQGRMADDASRISASRDVVQRLRAERLARGWTQKELAKRAGIERANLARLEAGKHSPRVETLESLARCLDLSLADLFESAHEAAEMHALAMRLMRSGVARLKADLKRQRKLGIIDSSGRRIRRELPAEMIDGTSEAV